MEMDNIVLVTKYPSQGVAQEFSDLDQQNDKFHNIYQQIDDEEGDYAQLNIENSTSHQNVLSNNAMGQVLKYAGEQPAIHEKQPVLSVTEYGKITSSDPMQKANGQTNTSSLNQLSTISYNIDIAKQYMPGKNIAQSEVSAVLNKQNTALSILDDTNNTVSLPYNKIRLESISPLGYLESYQESETHRMSTANLNPIAGKHDIQKANPIRLSTENFQAIGNDNTVVKPEFVNLINYERVVSEPNRLIFNAESATSTSPVTHVSTVGTSTQVESTTHAAKEKIISSPVREVVFEQSFVHQRMGRELIHMLNKGERELEIRLDPKELGRVSLNLSLNSDSVSLQMTASSAIVRDLLLGQAEKLKLFLADQNLSLTELSVSVDVNAGREGMAERKQNNNGIPASETLLLADWVSDSHGYLSSAELFRAQGGRLLDYFV